MKSKEYQGQSSETVTTAGLQRELPLYEVGDGVFILVNDHLCFGCDIEFTRKAGKAMADLLAPYSPEIILIPEAKAFGFAYEIAANLNHPYFAVARKDLKYLTEGSLSTIIKSITTPGQQCLHLDALNLEKVRGRKVALFDDVISSGGTLTGLLELCKQAEAEVVVISSVWLEGNATETTFQESLPVPLVSLGELPIYQRRQE